MNKLHSEVVFQGVLFQCGIHHFSKGRNIWSSLVQLPKNHVILWWQLPPVCSSSTFLSCYLISSLQANFNRSAFRCYENPWVGNGKKHKLYLGEGRSLMTPPAMQRRECGQSSCVGPWGCRWEAQVLPAPFPGSKCAPWKVLCGGCEKQSKMGDLGKKAFKGSITDICKKQYCIVFTTHRTAC